MHWLQTTSSDSLIKDCSLSSYHFNRLISSFCTTLIISAQFCLFNWFVLYLPCALCHFIYLFFSTMSSFVYLYSLYVHMFKLYLYIYCQCLMLTVCTKGLRVTQFKFSVCMCCTCGRIDNKADFDFDWYNNRNMGKTWPKKLLIVGAVVLIWVRGRFMSDLQHINLI